MHHRAPVRLAMLVVALLASLSASGLAVAHGLEHEHLAHEHKLPAPAAIREDDHGDDHDDDHGVATAAHHDEADAVTLRPPEHGHEHGHATIDVAPGARDIGRLVPDAVVSQVPALAPLTTVVEVRSAALVDHALLARADPASGPPPDLRAPPAC